MKLPSISIYIHIPWCLKKCPYCDFYSKTINIENIPSKKYIKNLLLDLKKNINFIKSRKIHSIFIGGGTPNLIHPKYIKFLIQEIKKIVSFSKNIEITLEANPKSVQEEVFFEYKEIGVNRLSLGIQSFNEKILKNIQRNYTFLELIKTIHMIKKINFYSLNFDLIFGLPQQTLKEFLSDLTYAINFKPQHISLYQLSIERNTLFYKKTPILPKEQDTFQMFNKSSKILNKYNYLKYEISSYSKLKYQCQHNLNYWKFGDYLGIGCGAHSKITLKTNKIIRIIKNKNISEYMNGHYIKKKYFIKKKHIPLEFFMNNFRLYKPCLRKNFIKYTGLKENIIKKPIEIAIKKKYLIQNKKYWITTDIGKLFLNNLLELFII
ncbi:radical SAM family heme chaperone HemW [Buchnera aphidicola (Chaitophorus viminalis)]|nr:radical SAM family heme chaperone HemW [Buchnera aphidicola (Chaitophorus viminalis)]